MWKTQLNEGYSDKKGYREDNTEVNTCRLRDEFTYTYILHLLLYMAHIHKTHVQSRITKFLLKQKS